MNRELALKIADAVLYEGYMLYPYRPSAIKNRQRWSFGTIYPPAYEEVARRTEPDRMRSECLVSANTSAKIHVHLRFLHLLAREVFSSSGQSIPSLLANGNIIETWEEGVPRSVELDFPLTDRSLRHPFYFGVFSESETLRDTEGHDLGRLRRSQQEVRGSVLSSVEPFRDGLWKLTLEVINETVLDGDPADRNRALLYSLLSAHSILSIQGGTFLSLLDPPDELREVATTCSNKGNFPVLLGEPGSTDMLLCSPILLSDYPQIAPESAGDFFDATEMDEMLTLRVMTLTDAEKKEMSLADDRVRALLQRTEETARDQLMRTHGVIRNLRPAEDR